MFANTKWNVDASCHFHHLLLTYTPAFKNTPSSGEGYMCRFRSTIIILLITKVIWYTSNLFGCAAKGMLIWIPDYSSYLSDFHWDIFRVMFEDQTARRKRQCKADDLPIFFLLILAILQFPMSYPVHNSPYHIITTNQAGLIASISFLKVTWVNPPHLV